ncbi:hypothetical protein ILYODFUR_035729 [Ilyodon furcidens]|uniref:Uncharacterized protein n=1 Tax=Ilyodon furcidens TaxID=33524 RepID=A0ABV0T2Y2_9TELE
MLKNLKRGQMDNKGGCGKSKKNFVQQRKSFKDLTQDLREMRHPSNSMAISFQLYGNFSANSCLAIPFLELKSYFVCQTVLYLFSCGQILFYGSHVATIY